VSSTSIEERLQRLEDIEAVRQLMAKYHKLCDGWDDKGTHKDPEAIAALFTADGVWAVTARQPPPTGRAEVAELARDNQSIQWIVHYFANPIVEVDGDTANGEFIGVLRVRVTKDVPKSWVLGRYRVVARREPEGWRFQSVAWEPFVGAMYEPPRQ
jgi:ketosteroid isomerase-like protein